MELELHLIKPRYEMLRSSCKRREARLLASIDRIGQQTPAVVVKELHGQFILVDGYKRLRALRKLRVDLMLVTCWDLPEQEALLLGRLMQAADSDSALEQGWLLQELRSRFQLTMEELARRFDRSLSWVSGRLGLVTDMPEPLQQMVRDGRLNAHGTIKHLLPLARIDQQGAIKLGKAIAPLRPSTRQTQALCAAYARGNHRARSSLLCQPEVFLRARERGNVSIPKDKHELLWQDLGSLRDITRRARAHLNQPAISSLLPSEQDELRALAESTRTELRALFNHLEKELDDAGRAAQSNHPQAS